RSEDAGVVKEASSSDGDGDCDAGELVAIKIFKRSLLRKHHRLGNERGALLAGDGLSQVQKEVAILKSVSHQNLVGLKEVIDDPDADSLYLVLEYIAGGPVMVVHDAATHSYRSPITGGALPAPMAASFFSDILCGLEFLHKNLICHRDIKPDNVLVDSRGVAKLNDLGLAHYFEQESLRPAASVGSLMRSRSRAQLDNTQGTWCFWAPEMCSEDQFNGLGADMWAAGVCLWVMCFGTVPFWDELPTELFEKIEKGRLPFPIPSVLQQALPPLPSHERERRRQLRDLLERLLERDPLRRMTIEEACEHPWVE
ncbi:unnamed protein product, partial [Phaeothamnion confervicola]